MAYVKDFTKNQQNYDLARSFLNQSMQPIQGANAATTLGKILTAYFASKGMRGAQDASEQAAQAQKDAKARDYANIVNVMTPTDQTTAYSPSEGEYFNSPNELPQGLESYGQGGGVQDVIKAMMGGETSAMQDAGLKAMVAQVGGGAGKYYEPVLLLDDKGKPYYGNPNAATNTITPYDVMGGITEETPQQKRARNLAAQIKAAKDKKLAIADADKQINKPLEEKQDKLKTTSINQTLDTIENALDKTGFWTSGFIGKISSILPGSAAYSLVKTVDTIKANLAFDSLTKMREASPTGGALGSVSERELNLLESAVASLDVGLEEEEQVANLRKVHRHYTGWKATLEGINPDEFGEYVEGLGYEVKRDGKLIGYFD